MSKHFTEAQLAAEFWAAENEAKGLIIDGYHPYPARREAELLLRFAIHPHYFEATEPESDTK